MDFEGHLFGFGGVELAAVFSSSGLVKVSRISCADTGFCLEDTTGPLPGPVLLLAEMM